MANKSSSSGRKTSARKATNTKAKNRAAEQQKRELRGIVLIGAGILLGIYLFVSDSGILGSFLSNFFFGMCGWFAYGLPIVLLATGAVCIAGSKGTTKGGSFWILLGVVDVMTLAQTATNPDYKAYQFGKYISQAYQTGGARRGGGVIGAFMCYPMQQLGGNALCYVLTILVLIVVLMFLTRISIRDVSASVGRRVQNAVSTAVISAREYVQASEEQREKAREERRMRVFNVNHEGPTELNQDEKGEPVQKASLPENHTEPVTAGDAYPQQPQQDSSRRKRRRETDEMAAFNAFAATLPVGDGTRKVKDKPSLRDNSSLSYLGETELKSRPKRSIAHEEPATASAPRVIAPETDIPAGDAIWEDLEPSDPPMFHNHGTSHVQETHTYSAAASSARAGTFAGAAVTGSAAVFTSVSGNDAGRIAKTNAASIPVTPPLPKEPAFHSVAVPDATPGVQEPIQEEPYTDITPEEALAELRKKTPSANPAPTVSAPDVEADVASDDGFPMEELADLESQKPPVYIPPSLELLNAPNHDSYGAGNENPKEIGNLLIETLASFGITAELTDFSVGPVITRFEIKPAKGVRVNKITALSNDIALALEASRVRIEAPIPGKAAVGIEIPNKHAVTVVLRDVIESRQFTEATSPITMALGKDTGGNVLIADLAKMPHMLIAGSTGSGKSVCINDLLISMIYKASPEELRLILIDPKVVELSVFAALPHLLVPVVTEPKKASGALRWAVNEMTLRYKKFSETGSRDLARYNSLMEDPAKRMPKLVVVIDELADLMMVAPDEVEDSICRIAQLGRAAGIHLIVATQRPSADIITGLIKANIPSRCAFAVSSGIDSRIILDETGAEKLLGRGDMLFHANGSGKPIRAQAAFVSDEEVEKIMEHFRAQKQEPKYDESIVNDFTNTAKGGPSGGAFGEGKQEDELLGEAVRIVMESGQASISMIQRRLRVGYARAARLIDMMEQEGYVSGFEGSKPRRVLIKRAQFEQLFGDGTYMEEDEGSTTDIPFEEDEEL